MLRGGSVVALAAVCSAGVAANGADGQRVVRVSAAAVGANDGSSWADAYVDLQDALASALTGDELWVAGGTYTPGPPDDAVSSFVLKRGVALFGGFAGYETRRDQRNWTLRPTILSGDVGRDDVYGAGAWYSGWNRNTANSGHVVVAEGTDSTAVLDGFVITAGATGPAGTGAGSPLMYGGGLYAVGGSPTVRNCTFTRNLAAFGSGGGVYLSDSDASFANCQFNENYVHLGSGAGIFIHGASAVTITDCDFRYNVVVTASGGQEGQGGGVASMSTLPVSITRCTFDGNIGRSFYACCPVEIARGGGVSSFGGGLTVRDCVFTNNQAHDGGGLFVWGDTTVINSVFWNNRANSIALSPAVDGGGAGGGLGAWSFANKSLTLINCVIAQNRGREAAGLVAYGNMDVTLRNSIVWGNVAGGQDVSPRDAQFKASATIEHTCVQDLLTAPPGEDPYDAANYPGSFDADPRFVALNTGSLRLSADSPCVGAGQNAFVPAGVVADLDGHARVLCGTVDMGPYEFGFGDYDCDRAVGPADVARWDECMTGPEGGSPAAGCESFDVQTDGAIDLSDFAAFSRGFAGS